MISSLKKILVTSLLAVVAFGLALPVFAADDQAPEAPRKAKAPKGMPFNGKIRSVDKTAKTITLDREKSNVLQITSQTKLVKDGKPAVFDDITVGEVVGGVAHEKDGKLEVSSLRVGPKPGAAAEGKQPKKEKKKDKAPEEK